MMNVICKSSLALAALLVAATTAHAVPVTYSFVTGAPGATSGVGAGLFGPSDTAYGTFTYDNEASSSPGAFTQGNWAGSGVVYSNVTNWEGFVAGQRFFDGVAGTYAGNDVAVSGSDAYGLTGTSVGGEWEPFSVGGHQLVMARVLWNEVHAGGDFLTSNDLLPTLPSFSGSLILFFGQSASNPTGWVAFNGFQATAVPESSALLLFTMGIPMMYFVRRRRTRA